MAKFVCKHRPQLFPFLLLERSGDHSSGVWKRGSEWEPLEWRAASKLVSHGVRVRLSPSSIHEMQAVRPSPARLPASLAVRRGECLTQSCPR
jgi:hypothetical protein